MIASFPNHFCTVRSQSFLLLSFRHYSFENCLIPVNNFSPLPLPPLITEGFIWKLNTWRWEMRTLFRTDYFDLTRSQIEKQKNCFVQLGLLEFSFLFFLSLSLQFSVNTFQFTTCNSTPLAIRRVSCRKAQNILCRCYSCRFIWIQNKSLFINNQERYINIYLYIERERE